MTATETPSIAREPAALAAATLCEAFQMTGRTYPDWSRCAAFGDAQPVTWAEYAQRVERSRAGWPASVCVTATPSP